MPFLCCYPSKKSKTKSNQVAPEPVATEHNKSTKNLHWSGMTQSKVGDALAAIIPGASEHERKALQSEVRRNTKSKLSRSAK